ncbi:tetratricopeptide repeat protein [Pseudoalteromonas rubra]|uniref:tetratricopeptide repeat protein n=1 Tax=Pseudoalteromonas rubra TaxID=43658 RepID=UPI0013DDC6EA|nr:tetratricopeptide repeat protein [Pseudoalteromonas rubra]
MIVFPTMLLSWGMALSTTASCNVPIELLKSQAFNQPQQAVQTYLSNQERFQRATCAEAALAYRYLLMAATRVQDWKLVEEVAQILQSGRLSPHVTGKELNVINNIGVAYRKVGQPEDALTHYRCALTYANSHDQRALIKINIAIVHRNADQPAIGFRLLQGIEEKYLPSIILAGLHVAKGNTALQLKRYDEAQRAYQQAREHYLAMGDKRNAQAVVANMLVVALAKNDTQAYDQLRALSTLEVDMLTEQGGRFIQWLDTFRSYSSANNLNQSQRQQLQDIEAIAADYIEFVMLLSARFSLNQAVARPVRNSAEQPLLSSALAKRWCKGM